MPKIFITVSIEAIIWNKGSRAWPGICTMCYNKFRCRARERFEKLEKKIKKRVDKLSYGVIIYKSCHLKVQPKWSLKIKQRIVKQ